ncbi:hypothetical protein [Fluoribacter dumoffii]|uniref:hypothetical protein n=1 Tax=Fluoribacter dumoffii TaxID=463 RepID=UPI002243FD2A|nr:hypothetical protein [Fluoribacter dumoffii]MCW8460603.1 hypothetical protein [Fluoribacter dumoffii]
MQSRIEITELERGELLKLTLNKLVEYKKENSKAVSEEFNFSHLPYDLEDLADQVFLRVYKPLHGMFPSSHYVCHVNTMITQIEQRMSKFEQNKPKIDAIIEQLGKEINLSMTDINTLKKFAYVLLDEEPYAECLFMTALTVLQEKNLLASDESQSTAAIKLVEHAFKCSLADKTAGVPKRYAFLLAEIYANARKELVGVVAFNAEKAIFYLIEACNHGSETAKKLLSESAPVSALLKVNGIDEKIIVQSKPSGVCQFGVFSQSEKQSSSSALEEITNTYPL